MHGLINRSIQFFITEAYGPEQWRGIAEAADVPVEGFEPMLWYDDGVTETLLEATSLQMEKTLDVILEDLGTFLVSNAKLEPLRRLLRFGGETYVEFLHSLDELRGRARLAVPDLEVPDLELVDDGGDSYRLICRWRLPGVGHLMIGALRAMADDYGALVLLDYTGWDIDGNDALHIDLLDSGFAEGRSFDLAVPAE